MNPLSLLKAMRPHQWVKNVFVLAALLFSLGEQAHSGNALDRADQVLHVLIAVAAFCLGSSAIYLVNDVMDVESDRKHPTKCNRPIAAGLVSIPVALAGSLGCVVSALALGWYASTPAGNVAGVVGGYMLMNLLYSMKLKHIAIVDAFCIAAGFLLRVIAGGFAAQAPLSHWLMLCTLFLALFLALCKRRAEIDLLGDDRGSHRKILTEYTPAFLDQSVVVLAACTIVNYTMYTVSPETAAKFGTDSGLVYTVPFVVFGLFRYLLLVQTQKGGGSPTRVLLGGDVVFLVNCVAWLGTVAFLLFW
ncbi:MAG: decaprenyl-phosphate phosphoribosyltransferase [Planctomycetota bacterium]|nr:decaprenyl-phosphate phosphoribosyltransferase [Planctomycetota bacterium]